MNRFNYFGTLKQTTMNPKKTIILFAILLVALIIIFSVTVTPIWKVFYFIGPLILLGIYDITQKKHAILRNFPIIGHGRYILEGIRPEIMQYFVETDTEGRPFNRIFRNVIYQRAKNVNDTAPFGTQMNVYRSGYEWMDHTIYASHDHDMKLYPRVEIGGPDCILPYSSSMLNVSAMSFGSLSKNAVMAMNWGARISGFSQNTGEGGISPYHLQHGGDLVWQVGTGYFGCRNADGSFSDEKYTENATRETVKMIELKISQGAKPGHGGILPGSKNTEEIAKIRGVEPHIAVHSPPAHSEFSNPKEMMVFIKKLRDLSGGKPIGFKLCIGKKDEFIDICKAMLETGIKPDFITVDGGEGGTGAAPPEFSNSIGMPLREGLVFAHDSLVGFDLKKDIKIIAAGKVVTGFHMARVLALGADVCNSARAMMMSVGCIQALECNNNKCPVGVATQNPSLMKGLDVKDKAKRAANYHHETIQSFIELVVAAGIRKPAGITRDLINKRMSMTTVMKYSEIYPPMAVGCFLQKETTPKEYINLIH